MKFSTWLEDLFGQGKIVMKVCILSFVWFAAFPPCSHALRYDIGSETYLDLDTTLTYGVSMRMKDQNSELLANPNADDGDRAFDKHDLISDMFKINSDIQLKYKNFGAFTRVRAFYDFAYMQKNANDSPATNNAYLGGEISDPRDFTDDAEDIHGRSIDVLDAFVFGNFNLGDRQLVVRVGNQVVSWGESLFTQGSISSAQSPIDATQSNTPGVELKDIFLPVGQVYSQLDLIPNLTLASYYQWEWKKTQLDAPGTYFSTSDLLDDGGEDLIYPYPLAPAGFILIPRGRDDKPRDSGQYGVSLRYVLPELNETEFGLYYLNYHEKLPNFNMNIPGMNYYLSYGEDIKLYGASVSTVIFDANVACEVAYRNGFPAQVEPSAAYAYEDVDVVQGLLSVINVFGPLGFIDNTTLTAEAGVDRVYNNDDPLVYSKGAWGYTAKLAFDFFTILPSLDLNIPVTWKQCVRGTSVLPGTFTEGANSISYGLDFSYLQNYKFGLKYTDFVGRPEENNKTDRDYLTFNVKYTF